MRNFLHGRLAAPSLPILGACLALGTLALATSIPAPARAEGAEVNVWQGRGSWQERGRREEHWQPHHRYNGYYSAPPVIYAEPYYYQQPGASLNFNFPLFR